MSAGWESFVRITRADAWQNPGAVTSRGFFLYADSVSPDLGGQEMMRDNKLNGIRESDVRTYSVDRWFPKAELTVQPRVDDILPILAAHFQMGTGANGTYTFFRCPRALNWGSNVGTNIHSLGTFPYSINMDVFYGNLLGGGTGADTIRLTNGIVDKLTFTLKNGEDLKITPSIKFFAGSYFAMPDAFVPQSVYGSMSEYPQFVDYMGSLVLSFAQGVAAESPDNLNFDGITYDFNNNTGDRGRLGYAGWTRFPFSGRYSVEGEVTGELSREFGRYIDGGTSGTVTFRVQTGTSWIQIESAQWRWKPKTVPISSGDSIIELTLPFKAYPPTGSVGPSTIVTVFTGTAFATSWLGF